MMIPMKDRAASREIEPRSRFELELETLLVARW